MNYHLCCNVVNQTPKNILIVTMNKKGIQKFLFFFFNNYALDLYMT